MFPELRWLTDRPSFILCLLWENTLRIGKEAILCRKLKDVNRILNGNVSRVLLSNMLKMFLRYRGGMRIILVQGLLRIRFPE